MLQAANMFYRVGRFLEFYYVAVNEFIDIRKRKEHRCFKSSHSSKSSIPPPEGAAALNEPNEAVLPAAFCPAPQSPAVALSFSRSLMDLPAPAPATGVTLEPRDRFHRSSKLEELLTAGAAVRLSVLEFVGADIVEDIAIGVGLKGAAELPSRFNGG
jgi:hypothetical protein